MNRYGIHGIHVPQRTERSHISLILLATLTLVTFFFSLILIFIYGGFTPADDFLNSISTQETSEIWSPSLNNSPRNLYPIESKSSTMDEASMNHSTSSVHSCGSWQPDYLKLHKDIMTSKRDKKLLIFSSGKECGGMGDHLAGMESAFLLAMLFNRAFLVEWDEIVLSKTMEPALFDWRLNPDTLAGYPDPTWYTWCPTDTAFDIVMLNFINYGEYPSPFYDGYFECLQRLQNVPVIKIRSNRGFSYISSVRDWEWKAKIKDLGFRPPYIVGCLLRSLIRIPDWIQKKAEPYLRQLKKPGRLSIGIHSRPGHADTLFDSNEGAAFIAMTQELFDCAQKLTSFWGQGQDNAIWFFMSPSSFLKKKFKETYKDKVISTDVMAKHIEMSEDLQTMVDVMMEWYIFSHCDFFVFHESGLSASAAMYSLRPNAAFKFGAKYRDQVCDPEVPSPIMKLATSWSGL